MNKYLIERIKEARKDCGMSQKEVAEKTGVKKMDLSRMFEISPAAVSKSFNANNPGLEVVARYLKVMGYTLYAVPSSLHIEAISDDAIKIEPEERKEKE